MYVKLADQVIKTVNRPRGEKLVKWVENKFLYFLDTYLQLEHHEQYQKKNLVHDPVCGTQVNKAFAISESARDSQNNYFCTEDCRAKFILEAGRRCTPRAPPSWPLPQ